MPLRSLRNAKSCPDCLTGSFLGQWGKRTEHPTPGQMPGVQRGSVVDLFFCPSPLFWH